MKLKQQAALTLCIPLVLFSGCHIGTPYQPPCVEVPDDWKATQPDREPLACVNNWWEVFDDQKLNEYEEFALQNSPNLYVALQRIGEARAYAGISESALLPQANLNLSYNDSRNRYTVRAKPSALPISSPIPSLIKIHELQYSLPLNLSYELDLWGRLSSQYDSAVYTVKSQEIDFTNSLLSLTSEVASTYFLIRSLDTQIHYLQSTVDVNRKNKELNQRRYNEGVSANIDVMQAEQLVAQAESVLYDVQRQRALQENVLALLMGLPASSFSLETSPLLLPPPIIPAGLPAEILARRPDLAKLEFDMAAQHKLIDSAYASFLPAITLTGALGMSSFDLKNFLMLHHRYWSFGSNLGQTIFDGGNKLSNLELAYVHFRETSGMYQQQVLVAFQEVENALSDLEWQAKQHTSLKAYFDASQQVVALSHRRYEAGVTNYLEVSVNQTASLNAQQNYLNLIGQQYLSTIQLIKALGGGWE